MNPDSSSCFFVLDLSRCVSVVHFGHRNSIKPGLAGSEIKTACLRAKTIRIKKNTHTHTRGAGEGWWRRPWPSFDIAKFVLLALGTITEAHSKHYTSKYNQILFSKNTAISRF